MGINVLVGKFVKINKRTGWNKRTGGKIEPKYCLIIPILLVNFQLSFEVWSKIEIVTQINKYSAMGDNYSANWRRMGCMKSALWLPLKMG